MLARQLPALELMPVESLERLVARAERELRISDARLEAALDMLEEGDDGDRLDAS